MESGDNIEVDNENEDMVVVTVKAGNANLFSQI